ncbi:MAG: exonuclease domain-containing protein [Lachnospiraceae bacterium]|nr:exonuclease domain-containing protein [Lachnospiraceae bacterium]
MKNIVVDLEMNPISRDAMVRDICGKETIEIGAVMLDDNLKEISSFRTYVKPGYNDIIEKNISRLTGITTEMVQNAPDFNEALLMFTNWCLGTGDEISIYAWSEADYTQIKREMLLKNYKASEKEALVLEREWFDFQHEFDTDLGFNRQLSLKTALEFAGVDFTGREHDALDDARNTAELLHTFRDEKLFNKTLGKIKEVMVPTKIGSTLGELFDFSSFKNA